MAQGTEAMLEKVLRAPATGGLARQSSRQLTDSELDQLEALMAQMKAGYPGQEIAQDTADVWTPLWMAQVIRYGMPAFRRALLDHMASSRFLPHPSELSERLEAMRPAQASVYVPSTRREVARLC